MRPGLWIGGLAAALLMAATPAPACRLALLLALDVSASVDEREYLLQRDGLAAALVAPEVEAAFLSSPVPVALAAYEWSGRYNQATVLEWRLIHARDDLFEAARTVASATRSETEFPTAMGYALGHAATLFARAPPKSSPKSASGLSSASSIIAAGMTGIRLSAGSGPGGAAACATTGPLPRSAGSMVTRKSRVAAPPEFEAVTVILSPEISRSVGTRTRPVADSISAPPHDGEPQIRAGKSLRRGHRLLPGAFVEDLVEQFAPHLWWRMGNEERRGLGQPQTGRVRCAEEAGQVRAIILGARQIAGPGRAGDRDTVAPPLQGHVPHPAAPETGNHGDRPADLARPRQQGGGHQDRQQRDLRRRRSGGGLSVGRGRGPGAVGDKTVANADIVEFPFRTGVLKTPATISQRNAGFPLGRA